MLPPILSYLLTTPVDGLVHNSDDAIKCDLDKLVEWAKLWQMAFKPSKCYTPVHYA